MACPRLSRWPRTWAGHADSLVSRGMANTQGPQGSYDPAGSTQMFRAFVDEAPRAAAAGGGLLVPASV